MNVNSKGTRSDSDAAASESLEKQWNQYGMNRSRKARVKQGVIGWDY
jgi:hypothetical protein